MRQRQLNQASVLAAVIGVELSWHGGSTSICPSWRWHAAVIDSHGLRQGHEQLDDRCSAGAGSVEEKRVLMIGCGEFAVWKS